jgi:hypothetical protein
LAWEGFHGADHLLAERRFDQVALTGPDFKSNADKFPTATGIVRRVCLSLIDIFARHGGGNGVGSGYK